MFQEALGDPYDTNRLTATEACDSTPRVKRRIVSDTDSASWVLGPTENGVSMMGLVYGRRRGEGGPYHFDTSWGNGGRMREERFERARQNLESRNPPPAGCILKSNLNLSETSIKRSTHHFLPPIWLTANIYLKPPQPLPVLVPADHAG
jgi:hypothetical protein